MYRQHLVREDGTAAREGICGFCGRAIIYGDPLTRYSSRPRGRGWRGWKHNSCTNPRGLSS